MSDLEPDFRLAKQADGPAIRDLIFSVLKEYGLQPAPTSTDQDLFDLEAHYFDVGGEFWVLSQNEVIIGTFGLAPRKAPEELELRKMYLGRSFRGRGLGRRLMTASLTRARALGYSTLVLETANVLKEAIALYESVGFTRSVGTQHPLASRCDAAYELLL